MTSSATNADVILGAEDDGRPHSRHQSSVSHMLPMRFILTVIGLTGVLHAYIGLRLLPALDPGSAGIVLGIVLLALSTLLIPFGLLARALPGRLNEPVASSLTWAGLIGGGFASSLLVLTAVRDLLLLLAMVVLPTGRFQAVGYFSAWGLY